MRSARLLEGAVTTICAVIESHKRVISPPLWRGLLTIHTAQFVVKIGKVRFSLCLSVVWICYLTPNKTRKISRIVVRHFCVWANDKRFYWSVGSRSSKGFDMRLNLEQKLLKSQPVVGEEFNSLNSVIFSPAELRHGWMDTRRSDVTTDLRHAILAKCVFAKTWRYRAHKALGSIAVFKREPTCNSLLCGFGDRSVSDVVYFLMIFAVLFECGN